MFDAEKIYDSLVRAGNDWADKNHAAEILEESRKSVLAELMLTAPGKSNAEKESQALASDGYKEHVKEMVSARKAANRARVNYDAQKMLAELRRSEAATERQAMRNSV